MQLPYTLTNGSQFDVAELQDNLEALRDGFDQIKNANIVDAAAIDKYKLAQRGALARGSFLLVPATANTSLDTTADAGFTLPAAFQTKHTSYVVMDNGQVGALCQIDLLLEEAVIGGADWPEIEILIDGVQFMGQSVVLDTNGARYKFGNANGIANPGYPVSSDSVIQYRLRRTGAGAPTIRGLSVTEHVKTDLVAM